MAKKSLQALRREANPVAEPKTIELPLKYARSLEECAGALAGLLDEAPSIDGLRRAKKALKRHCDMQSKLANDIKDLLDIWE